MSMSTIKNTVAKNLQELRKSANLTQSELAKKLNYSDKSVSKWETGESLPDIEVLYEIANLYGVTLDYLTSNAPEGEKSAYIKNDTEKANKIIISALFVTAVWFVATLIYVYINLYKGYSSWQAFVWAFPASIFTLIILNGKWGVRKFSYPLASIFTWSFLLATCFQWLSYNLWAVLAIGIPVQIAIILISKLKK